MGLQRMLTDESPCKISNITFSELGWMARIQHTYLHSRVTIYHIGSVLSYYTVIHTLTIHYCFIRVIPILYV